MSHKVHPIGFRLGINVNWNSRWFDIKKYPQKLSEDIAIRGYLTKKLRGAGLERVEIERTVSQISVIIHSSRPGIVIGRAGAGVEGLTYDIEKILRKVKMGSSLKEPQIKIEVREIRNPETFASLVGLGIAEQIERRMPFRQVMKRTMDRIMANKVVKGARIGLAGRLGGSEMARREWIKEGTMPRNTIRSDIDFSVQEAYTTYGVIGIKVWIYKGQKLE
ncbi:MAG: 30S ribosomal protein S3 [Candidatus Spechtbacterales bacterium]